MTTYTIHQSIDTPGTLSKEVECRRVTYRDTDNWNHEPHQASIHQRCISGKRSYGDTEDAGLEAVPTAGPRNAPRSANIPPLLGQAGTQPSAKRASFPHRPTQSTHTTLPSSPGVTSSSLVSVPLCIIPCFNRGSHSPNAITPPKQSSFSLNINHQQATGRRRVSPSCGYATNPAQLQKYQLPGVQSDDGPVNRHHGLRSAL